MNADAPFRKVAILGLGLIGGSLALALREARAATLITGFDADPGTLAKALALGAVDAAGAELGAALSGAELVVFATPVGAMEGLLRRVGPFLAPGAALTDCASTKGEVARWARAHLPEHHRRFVPGHPIAGSEASGIEAARADLFRGARTILCPFPEGDPEALAGVSRLWRSCGAEVCPMAPAAHDAVFAAVSHLPQVLAYALAHMLARRPGARHLMAQGGPGFRDFTRLAASHPVLWRDVCLTNRAALLGELRGYQEELGALAEMLETADGAALERVFAVARQARAALP